MSFLCSKGHRVSASKAGAGGTINVDSLCSICKRQALLAQHRANPFFAGMMYGGPTFTFDAPSRLERVAKFNRDQCRRALHVDGLQKAVRVAVERRLKRLEGQ